MLAAIVNPKRVRDFARGMGLEAKTDRVDARLIARYGEVMRPAATPAPDPARTELREILACRRQLIDEITVRTQQLEHLQTPAMRERVTKTLAFLRQEAKELAKLLRQTIQADAALAADFALLTSMPGCGPILAATLLAELPELGRLDRRKVAALAGLAPVARDSGLREHKRVIKGGRGQVRRALYMAAVASLRIKASPLQGPLRPAHRQRQSRPSSRSPPSCARCSSPSTPCSRPGRPGRPRVNPERITVAEHRVVAAFARTNRGRTEGELWPRREPPGSRRTRLRAQPDGVAAPCSSWRARSPKSSATTSNSRAKPVSR